MTIMNSMKTASVKQAIIFITLFLSFEIEGYGQELNLQNVNNFENPQHKDNVGSIARTDTIFVQGTYTTDKIVSINLKLLTYQKNPWSLLLSHELVINQSAELTGNLDTFLVVPADYMLGGNPDNSQFLQIRAAYSDNSIFANLYLTVTEKPTAHQTLVDFDEKYGSATGTPLMNNINNAISTMGEGDTLLFKSAEYNFEGTSLSVSKAICISGKLPASNTSENMGAYDVNTVFNNLKGLNVQSDNFHIANIELSADTSTGYVFTRVSHATNPMQHYTGIEVNNVILRNGRVQCFGGNGAGVDFTNVSFLDFTQGGYYLNRSERIDSAPKFQMNKCLFKPKAEAINFNVRAISLDAGNTEYPVVWNQNNSTIDHCLLDGTGLGISSKCSYVNVTNCHFKGYRMDVDMIHIEEFGHHFLIDGNTFEHISPARTIYIDREIQQCHDITITNNKWIGQYGWIISALSPYNLVMENNDFSEAWAKNTSDKTIDLTFDHSGETQFTKYDLPAHHIVFKNNKGLDSGKDGIFAYKALAGDTSMDIEYPVDKIQVTTIPEAPQSIVNTSVFYRIRNKQSGEYLRAVSGQSKLELSQGIKADSSDVWEFTFEYPYFYYLRNRGTKNYIEVYRGYTMGDYNNDTQEQLFVEQTDFFNEKTEKPRWYLRTYEKNGSTFYEILPGGNEQKSRSVQVGKYMELEFARIENKGQLLPEDDSSWELIPVSPVMGVNDSKIGNLKVYPNPATSKLNIDLREINKHVKSLSIYSTCGKLMYFNTMKEQEKVIAIDVKNFHRGLYILSIGFENTLFSNKVTIN